MASSGRYRSNVFNFLSRQSMRLQDQVSQTWRQAKMTAVWGAQILLYPLYVGFQATRLVGKQLRQTAQRVLPKLRAIVQVAQPVEETPTFLFSDTPIQRSLQTLNDFELLLPADRLALQLDPQDPNAPGIWVVVGGKAIASSLVSSLDSPSSLTSKELSLPKELLSHDVVRLVTGSPTKLAISNQLRVPEQPDAIQIQGIAALLDSHQLVLVDVKNQLLDVLSAEQQLCLQRRIADDVASYWRQQRLLDAENYPWVDRFLPLPKERTLALPPIRAFWQLMAWMQTSPVAVATNLFQEARLQEARLLHSASTPLALPDSVALRSAASWETGGELGGNLRRWFRDRLHLLLAPELPYVKASSNPLIKASSGDVQSLSFSPPNLSLASSNGLERSLTPPQIQMHDSLSLTMPSRRDIQPTQTAASKLAPKSEMTSKPEANQIISSTTEKISAVPAAAENTELIAKPDWLEVEVQLVAYEKHPIEQLLDWIDRGMSWMENRVVETWKWLRDHWSI
jgi:hypothetical protein